MPVWTVDTWRIKPETEAHFLPHCGALSAEPLVLYRDVHELGLYWSPAKWESMEALNEWRTTAQYGAAVRSLDQDVMDHQTHVMSDVPGFLPQGSKSDQAS